MRKHRDYQRDAAYLLGRDAYARRFYREGRHSMFWLYRCVSETNQWAAEYVITWFHDNFMIIAANHNTLWLAGAQSAINALDKREVMRERQYYDAVDAANRGTNWDAYFSALENSTM
jgi:hypothetical protein